MDEQQKLAYAAGIMDGEGTVGVQVAKPNEKAGRISPSYRIRVRVGMCDRGPIDFLHSNFGGFVYYCSRKENPRWNPSWEWTLRSKDAVAFLKKLLPYLLVKGPVSEAAIQLGTRVSPRPTYSEPGRQGVKRTSSDELGIREQLYQRIKHLNSNRHAQL